LDDSIVKKMIQ